MNIDLDRLRLKLRFKIVYHLGLTCPDTDRLIEETLRRFFLDERSSGLNRVPESATLLNSICRQTILDYQNHRLVCAVRSAFN